MSWTAPRTWVAAEVLTAANFNTHIRDNLDAAAGANKAACRVFNSATQSIANNTVTAVTHNSETYDRQSLHSTSVNTSRVTIPSGWGGVWRFTGHIEFAANATGERHIGVYKNAGGVAMGGINTNAIAGGARPTILTVADDCSAVAGDFFELSVFQTSGGALNVSASTGFQCEFEAMWVSA